MLKKRIIFTLLYNGDAFSLSRNFRLQRVGDIEWLLQNYNFKNTASHIDELIILDVSRKPNDKSSFNSALKSITANCFIPVAAGGGIRSIEQARALLRSGADKIIVNTPLFKCKTLVKQLVEEFGQQSIVGSIDVKREYDGSYTIYTDNASKSFTEPPSTAFQFLENQLVGEVYLNSINQDGTGQGYDFMLLDLLPKDCQIPVILAGGAGNSSHLFAGLKDMRVSAVATAHLYNFIGDGLQRAREHLARNGIDLPCWPDISV